MTRCMVQRAGIATNISYAHRSSKNFKLARAVTLITPPKYGINLLEFSKAGRLNFIKARSKNCPKLVPANLSLPAEKGYAGYLNNREREDPAA